MMKNPYEIILRPVNTEKSNFATALDKYTFEVDINANKLEIAEAVCEIFDVEVAKVNVIKSIPKFGRWGRKTVRRKPAQKKAIVTLSPGYRIDIFNT